MGGAGRSATAWPMLAGAALGAAAAAWAASGRRRRLDPRILRALPRTGDPPMVVFVPGILGSQLLRPDGTEAWLNIGNTIGHHDLSLPRKLPFARSRDDLHPGFLVGTDAMLPRAFGFTEYADVLDLLDAAGYEPGVGPGLRYGGAEPSEGAPVTWAGAPRVASLVLAAVPNAGSIPALGAVLSGERVGL